MPSKLFGNARNFLFLDPKTNQFTVTKNTGCGNGIATAGFLLENGVTSALYTYLGDGPFYALRRGGAKIFYMGEEPGDLGSLLNTAMHGTLVEVTEANAKEMLNPGTDTGACECGCSHE